ncbi:MAG: hypothetical protein KDA36_12905, partial [Planctomycetaceae bacterium]|nr:hypothetical protein [Planctomycetaceae bacterium]
MLLLTMVLSGLAGGMAWGIRGQYGHETGAMMFGVLVGLTLVMLFMPRGSVLKGARAVGLLTLAIGFGGSMSYGQTVGLTMDGGVHGNIGDPHWNGGAYWWAMLGLAVKGGLWIGFGGAFLGMGLGAKRYRPKEMMWLGLGMMGLFVLGRWLLNTPFDPDLRKLPSIYFSDHWRWEPAENVNPRPEVWGGLLLAFTGLMAYLTLLKGDRLARNLGLWGIIGGLGFPIGQSLQAATAWDGATFHKNSYWQVGVNTWNLMEVTFGTVAGLALGIGLWCNRRAIAQDDEGEVSLSTEAEGWLIGSYTYLLCMSWYFGDTIFVLIQYHGLLMGILPMIAIVGGRYSALLYTFPVIAIPITFKTFLAICGSAEFEAKSIGLIAIVTVPLALLTAIALEWGKHSGNR